MLSIKKIFYSQNRSYMHVFLLGSLIVFTSCEKKVVEFVSTIKHEEISLPTQDTLKSVFFVTNDIGFIAGNKGTIFKTTDKGLNWQSISTSEQESIRKILFTTSQIGFYASQNGIYSTLNGGTSWSTVLNDENVNDFYFISASTGFAVCEDGKAFKTMNGGTTWQVISIAPWPLYIDDPLKSVHFLDSLHGYIVGDDGILMYTQNGGNSWSGIYGDNQSMDPAFDVFFKSSSEVYVVGQFGMLYQIEPGNTLEYLSSKNLNQKISYPIYAIDFYGNNGLAVGENGVYQAIWEPIKKWDYLLTESGNSFNKTLLDVHFLNETTAFAVGAHGTVIKFLW